MQGNDIKDCLQRKSALVTMELSQLVVDIAALIKVCLAGLGLLVERGAGYTVC